LRQPVIIAGGLNPQNVQEALGIFHPWGVDVVSGVESYPGRKHPGLVAQFIDAVRQFDSRQRKDKDKEPAQKGIGR
jgi:phosphoribosylanthranilate isomerase